MAGRIWEEVSQVPVPPTPRTLGQRVHERINLRLIVGHMAEVAACVVPFAGFHFLVALGSAVKYALTGSYPKRGAENAERDD